MSSAVVALRRSRGFRTLARLTGPVRARVDIACVYHRDLRGAPPDFRADIQVEMSRATPAEVDEAALLAGPQFVDRFRARLDEGMACFVAKVDGRVVAYNWTRYSSGEDEGDILELRPGEIYTTDAFTEETLRGRRIHGETLGFMLRTAHEEGYVEAYTMRSLLKRASRKPMAKLGWRVSGWILRVRVGGRVRVVRLRGSARPFRGGAV